MMSFKKYFLIVGILLATGQELQELGVIICTLSSQYKLLSHTSIRHPSAIHQTQYASFTTIFVSIPCNPFYSDFDELHCM